MQRTLAQPQLSVVRLRGRQKFAARCLHTTVEAGRVEKYAIRIKVGSVNAGVEIIVKGRGEQGIRPTSKLRGIQDTVERRRSHVIRPIVRTN